MRISNAVAAGCGVSSMALRSAPLTRKSYPLGFLAGKWGQQKARNPLQGAGLGESQRGDSNSRPHDYESNGRGAKSPQVKDKKGFNPGDCPHSEDARPCFEDKSYPFELPGATPAPRLIADSSAGAPVTPAKLTRRIRDLRYHARGNPFDFLEAA